MFLKNFNNDGNNREISKITSMMGLKSILKIIHFECVFVIILFNFIYFNLMLMKIIVTQTTGK